VIFAGAYVKKAAEKMAEKDFKDTGLADVFRTSLSAVQYLIKLVKHTRRSSGWDFSQLKWRNENSEVGVLNDKGEVLYIPAGFLKWYTSAPAKLIQRITESVKPERVLIVGVRNGDVFDEVSVNETEKILFDDPALDDDELDVDAVLPELEHGQRVKLEGTLTRGNASANSMGFDYKGHVLFCIPQTGNVRQFKSALFLRCIVEGTITRLAKHQAVLEKRPTIIVEKVTPLEYEGQNKLF
jgi:hypothetical protein